MDFIVRPVESETRLIGQPLARRRRRERRNPDETRDEARERQTPVAHHADETEDLGESIDLIA